MAVALLATLGMSAGCDDAKSTTPAADAGPGDGGMGGAGGGGGAGGMGGAGGTGGDIVETCLRDTDCLDTQYCFVAEGDLEGACVPGCREGGCDAGQTCDLATHMCADVPCAADADCDQTEWCNAGACEAGCRLDPDNCTPSDSGATRQCNADRACVELLPCCSADNACSEALEADCDGQVLRGVPSCVVDGLPEGTDACSAGGDPGCESDDACDAGFYCNGTDNRCYPGCRRDDPSSCPTDQVCDDKNRCVDLPCTADGDCPDDFYCDTEGGLICRTGCRVGSCPAGGDCNTDTRICERPICDPDDPNACGPDQYCDARLLICREEGCEPDSSNCEPDEFCDSEIGRCEAGCRDDANEANDSTEAATEIVLGMPDANGARRGTAMGQVICSGNADFFAVTVPANERIRVTVTYNDNGIDALDARLHGDDVEDGPLLFDSPQVPERFDFPPVGTNIQHETTYYIEVFGNVAESLEYTLGVQTSGAAACFADDSEPNDTARDGRQVEGNQQTFAGQTICADDEDWFCADLATGSGLTLTLTAAPGSGALAMEVFSLTRAQQAGGLGNPNYGEDDVTVRDIPAGTEYSFHADQDSASFSDEQWCVRVRPDAPNVEAEYDLRFEIQGGSECPNDGNTEPNDDRATAVDLDGIAALTTDDLLTAMQDLEVPLETFICARDIDFFCFTAEEGDILEAWAVGDGVAGELAVQFYDPAGVPVGREARHTASGEMPDKADVANTVAGRYCVSVDGQGPAQGPYTLNLNRSPVGDGVCAADRIEAAGPRNDSSTTATQLPDVSPNGTRFEYQTGYICDAMNADFDWYRFPVGADSAVCVVVDGFVDARTNIQAELFKASGNPNGDGCANDGQCGAGLACVNARCTAANDFSTTAYDFELMKLSRGEIGALGDGDYLVRVSHADMGESAYNLSVTVQPAADPCPDDWQELGDSNDDQLSPSFLGAGQVGLCDAWVCDNERGRQTGDWFEVTVPANQDRTILIEYSNNAEGQLGLEMYGDFFEDPADMLSNFVKSEVPQLNHECINIRGGAAEMNARMHVWLSGGAFVGDGNRVDYSLRVVPTDLDVNPTGACAVLGANQEIDSCPPREDWIEIPGLGRIQPDGCWPQFTVVAP